jgi:hypothetical protein
LDTADFGNGVVEKMGAASGPLKDSDAISPSMSYHCDTVHLRTRAEAEARH